MRSAWSYTYGEDRGLVKTAEWDSVDLLADSVVDKLAKAGLVKDKEQTKKSARNLFRNDPYFKQAVNVRR